MPHLNEAQLVLMGSQRFEESVDAVAGKTEDRIDAPLDQPLNDQIRNLLRHDATPHFVSYRLGYGRESADVVVSVSS